MMQNVGIVWVCNKPERIRLNGINSPDGQKNNIIPQRPAFRVDPSPPRIRLPEDTHTVHALPLPSFPVQCFATYNAGPCQGQGTVWNLLCSGWRLSGDMPMHPEETLSLTIHAAQ